MTACDADDVAEVELLEIGVVFAIGQFVAGDVSLNLTVAILDLNEASLAHDAEDDNASGY